MYEIILLPLLEGLIAQFIKFFISSNHLKASLVSLTSYSGMPSGHSAIMISLATIIGLREGLDSSIFAICLIVAMITIRDAIGLRQYLGQHGKTLNRLVKDLDDDKMLDNTYPHLLEKIGHTPLQVLIGGIIGFLVSLVGFLVLK